MARISSIDHAEVEGDEDEDSAGDGTVRGVASRMLCAATTSGTNMDPDPLDATPSGAGLGFGLDARAGRSAGCGAGATPERIKTVFTNTNAPSRKQMPASSQAMFDSAVATDVRTGLSCHIEGNICLKPTRIATPKITLTYHGESSSSATSPVSLFLRRRWRAMRVLSWAVRNRVEYYIVKSMYPGDDCPHPRMVWAGPLHARDRARTCHSAACCNSPDRRSALVRRDVF
ncbi:MAG: hypothetical protein ABIF28_08910 [Pseudomonadota bacterium]